jgi:hypothetical protein
VVCDCPRALKREREGVAWLQRPGVERPVVRSHGVRGVALVGPPNRRTRLDGDLSRIEAEILDGNRLLVALSPGGRH